MNFNVLFVVLLSILSLGCGGSEPTDENNETSRSSRREERKRNYKSTQLNKSEPMSVKTRSTSTNPKSPKTDRRYHSVADLIEIIEPSVVRIDVETDSGGAIGSGFLVSDGGLIFTNHHVIERATSATVTFRDGSKAEIQGTVYLDSLRDIAILKIKASRKFAFLQLGKGNPRKGEKVVAFGSPKGLSFSASEGIVSGIRSAKEIKNLQSDKRDGTWIQTTAPISGGNSGGPLVDLTGRVVGANTLGSVSGKLQNLNFAISSSDISKAIDLAKGKQIVPLTENKTKEPLSKKVISSDSPAVKVLAKYIDGVADKRVMEITTIKDKIRIQLISLKRAILTEDRSSETEIRSRISESSQKIKELIAADLPIPSISPFSPKTGEVGIFHEKTRSFKLIQVIDKSSGSALIRPRLGTYNGKSFFISGLNLSSIVDGDSVRFNNNLVIEVVGTRTYKAVAGGTNTVFSMRVAMNVSKSRARLQERLQKESVSSIPKLVFTEKEKMQLASLLARQKKQRELLAKQKLMEENDKKSKGLMRLAEQLLLSGKDSSAKKWLQDIIKKYPDTKAAKEAAVMNLDLQVAKEKLRTRKPAKKKPTNEFEKVAAIRLRIAKNDLNKGRQGSGNKALQELIKKYSLTDSAKEARAILKQQADNENKAQQLVKLAKRLFGSGKKSTAKTQFMEIIKKYPETKAAKEAAKLLKELKF